jgi:predicted nucleic acid-binding protein
MTEILVDSNVLVYAHDLSEPEKQRRALEVLDRLVETALGVLSAQTLAEFYAVTTRKLPSPLSAEQAYAQIEHFIRIWPILDVTSQVVLEAARGARDYRFSFWDAQLWAAARLHNVPVVFSEDFNPDSVIEGVRFVNPFADDFRAEDWGAESTLTHEAGESSR